MAKRARGIKPPPRPKNRNYLRFSFEYLDSTNAEFPMGQCSDGFILELFRQMQRYMEFTVDEFIKPCLADHRHEIKFEASREPSGFGHIDPSREDLWTEQPVQFALPRNDGGEDKWRVHGFVSGNVFYIVWLDHNHYLNPVGRAI